MISFLAEMYLLFIRNVDKNYGCKTIILQEKIEIKFKKTFI